VRLRIVRIIKPMEYVDATAATRFGPIGVPSAGLNVLLLNSPKLYSLLAPN
jgi:hypothetical protein